MLKDNNKVGPCIIPNCDKNMSVNNLLLVSVETASVSVKLGCCGFKLLSLHASLWEGSLTRGVLACVEETKLFIFLVLVQILSNYSYYMQEHPTSHTHPSTDHY